MSEPSSPAADEPSRELAAAEDQRDALAAQAGNQAALETLIRRHHAAVTRLLWRFVRNREDLEDLVQDTFLRLVRYLPTWRAEKPFNHWLRRIAANAGRDFYRRQSVRRRWRVDASSMRVDDDGTVPEFEGVDPSPDPAARAAAEEIKATLEKLSADDRAVLTLHYLEGWDLATIADQYGWSVTATKLRAFRARARLRALL